MATAARTLTTAERYHWVGVFRGLEERFIRISNCFVAVLFILFSGVLSRESLEVEALEVSLYLIHLVLVAVVLVFVVSCRLMILFGACSAPVC